MKTIHEGLLGDKPYYVSVLNKSHLPEVLELQDLVCEALTDKDILQPLSEEEFEFILEGNGIMIGAYADAKLIGFRALLIPPIDDEHLGYDIGLEKESELKRVLYQEISSVNPNYRGFGLQKTLASVIMKQIDTDSFDYVATTVMPYNIPSLKDKFSQGFYIVALKYIYGGKLRYVFALDLRGEPHYEEEVVTISMGDVEAQQRLLSEGFVGVRMKQLADDWVVEYQKIK